MNGRQIPPDRRVGGRESSDVVETYASYYIEALEIGLSNSGKSNVRRMERTEVF